MALVTKTQLENAATDAGTLETFVNGAASPGTLTTRTGQSLKTLARIQQDVLAAAAVPIWGVLWLGSTGTGADATMQSGGISATRIGVGAYKVSCSQFTTKTKVMITVSSGPGATSPIEVYQGPAQPGTSGEIYIHCKSWSGSTASFADIERNVTFMTFPQML